MTTLRDEYPLEKVKPLKKTIQWIIRWLVVFIILLLITKFTLLYNPQYTLPVKFSVLIYAFIFLLIVGMIIRYIYEVYYMKYYFYDIFNNNLIIRKGILWRNEIILPLDRIQDVYVDQDILDRIFNLCDVHVSSATMISASLSHIDGVNKQNGESIKNIIISKIKNKEQQI